MIYKSTTSKGFAHLNFLKLSRIYSILVDEYRVDGVIDVILQACHTYSVESYSINKFMKEQKHTPYMSLETDYSQNDVGQLKTRIAAFIEMI
ncbi:2-hydroxyacyl-CoA dehydratase family protein [Clostridium bowmanii]|nr:2-hydroxyacyl-CoA dehydratase family protein [Clostridium bowmanii]